MTFLLGFIVWLVVGILAGFLAWTTYRGAATTAALTYIFGVFGAFIGGMLGMSGYVFHAPEPLRFGGLLGAVLGAVLFAYMYHFVARKAV